MSVSVALIVEYPASVPFAFHLITKVSKLPAVIGKLTPVDVGAVPNVFIATVPPAEEYCPVTYMF